MDELAVHAALRLVGDHAARLQQIETGLRWSEHARAKATRLGDPSLRAGVFNNVAMVHSVAGEPERALESFEAALELVERNGGMGVQNVRAIHDNLGIVLRELGRVDEALAHQRLALEASSRELGPRHPDTASVWNNIGVTYLDKGAYDEAERAFEAALAIRREALDPGHPFIGSTLMNMGNLASARCQLARAVELYEEVEAMLRARFGPEHPSVASTVNNVGNVQLQQDEPARALESFTRACAVWVKALGEDHRYADLCAMNHARALLGTGRAAEALPYAQRTLALRSRGESPNPGDLAMALTHLTDVELSLEMVKEAGEHSARALALAETAVMEPGDVAHLRFTAARALWAAKRAPARAREPPSLRATACGARARAARSSSGSPRRCDAPRSARPAHAVQQKVTAPSAVAAPVGGSAS
ncbi:MAG: tetratricopeptide repeat protein [Myxococcales bacterium]|nr:tetratricopeptide repeat protein [Myxococcales bacterium]